MNEKFVRSFIAALLLVLCVQLFLANRASAGSVTSEKLSIGDVQPFIEKDIARQGGQLVTIYGVAQTGNTATVYFTYKYRGQLTGNSYNFIRLNSGKWFRPSTSVFLNN